MADTQNQNSTSMDKDKQRDAAAKGGQSVPPEAGSKGEQVSGNKPGATSPGSKST